MNYIRHINSCVSTCDWVPPVIVWNVPREVDLVRDRVLLRLRLDPVRGQLNNGSTGRRGNAWKQSILISRINIVQIINEMANKTLCHSL
jgi:hypothetical protein